MKRLIKKSSWKSAFPDFEGNMDVTIPVGFTDVSYKNDVCPSFLNEELGLQLFIDYKDQDDREMSGQDRFCITNYNSEEHEPLIESNDYNVILNFINNYKPSKKVEE